MGSNYRRVGGRTLVSPGHVESHRPPRLDVVGALRDRAQRAGGEDERVGRETLERPEPWRACPVGRDHDCGGGGRHLKLLDDVRDPLDLGRVRLGLGLG